MDELNDLDEEIAMEEMQGKQDNGNIAKKEDHKNEEDQLNDLINY